MKRICKFLAVLFLFSSSVIAEELNMEQAIALAETFILENGYTNADAKSIKQQLDFESIERTDDRVNLLKYRFDSLKSKAIGAKKSDYSWSIAFDYSHVSESCRVIIMKLDGSSIKIVHQDGIRDFFKGFEVKAL